MEITHIIMTSRINYPKRVINKIYFLKHQDLTNYKQIKIFIFFTYLIDFVFNLNTPKSFFFFFFLFPYWYVLSLSSKKGFFYDFYELGNPKPKNC